MSSDLQIQDVLPNKQDLRALFSDDLSALNESSRQVEKKAKAWAKATLKNVEPKNSEIYSDDAAIVFWQNTLPHLPMDSDSQYFWAGVFYEFWQMRPKNQGVFYTPRPLARYLTRQTLHAVLDKAKRELSEILLKSQVTSVENALTAFQNWLVSFQQLRILDPAAGCGVFLSEALFLLTCFYDEVREILRNSKWASWCDFLPKHPAHFVLQRNLAGIELDPVAVWIAKWALLRQAVANDGLDLAVEPRIEIGNSLDDSILLNHAVYDFILMNPPYTVEVRDNAALFQWIRTESVIRAEYQPKMDLADGFLLLANRLLKPKGLLGAVLPEYWLSRTQAAPIRQKYMTQMTPLELGLFGEQNWFSRAKGHHTSILIAQKNEETLEDLPLESSQSSASNHLSFKHLSLNANISLKSMDIFLSTPELQSPNAGKILYFPNSFHLNVGTSIEIGLLEKIHQFETPLIQPDWIQQGVVLPQGRINAKNHLNQTNALPKSAESGVFLITSAELDTLNLTPLETAQLKPYFLPKQFKPGVGLDGQTPAYWLIYADQQFVQSIQDFPNLKKHLDRCAVWNTSDHRPYGLHRARQSQWFEASTIPRLYGLRQTLKPCFSLVEETAYVNEGFYIIAPKPMSLPKNVASIVIKNIETLLNSPLFYFWACHQKRKGIRLQLDKDVLCRFPIPESLEQRLDSQHIRLEEISKAYRLTFTDKQWLDAL